MTRRGLLFVVSAPSGTGKTTLVERLTTRVPNVVQSRSYTSRPPRSGEVDGVDYNFIKEKAFRRMVKEGAFLEWAEVFGHLYGTSAEDTERHRLDGVDVVLVIDVQGAQQLRQRGVDAVSIFVLPPSLGVLEERLRRRSQRHLSEDGLQRRLRTARGEIETRIDYDYVVVNDDIEACVDRIQGIVIAARSTGPVKQGHSGVVATKCRSGGRPHSD